MPKEGLSPADIRRIRKDCTVEYKEYGEKEILQVKAFKSTANYMAVPRYYGVTNLRTFKGLRGCQSRLAGGYEAFEDVEPVSLFDYQKPWVEDMLRVSDTRHDWIGQAATGKGKTVMGVEVVRRIGATTLIIVDQENLIEQWEDALTNQELLGMDPDRVGLIQSTVCDYEGKDVVIAMLQSLVARKDKYPKEMYNYFGAVIFDEVHGVSAPVYHQVLCMFPAVVRFGVTATLKTGPLKKLSDLHLGPGAAVELREKHKESVVRYIENDTVYSWYANISPKDGRFLSEVAEDTPRNLLLTEAIEWLWESGRDVLVIGARIGQLENLMAMCALRGVPEDAMGLYTGRYSTWRYAKDKTPKSRPQFLQPGAEYTPVALQLVEKKTPKGVLDSVKQNAQVLFATYSMFAKGVNVPRLSAGVDATPRSRVQQTHGRILRSNVPKHTPIWVTIRDINSYRAEYQFQNRIHEYQESNAEVYQWLIGHGVKHRNAKTLSAEVRKRVKLLKQAKIVTRGDGTNTLMIPATATR